MHTSNKSHTLIGWITFFISLTVYYLTLEPTASFWDSGEFIASSYKLQIPHPPGPPLFLLIGRLFSMFAFENPESIGFWVNMLSAVSSATTVMFIYWIVVMLGQKLDQKLDTFTLALSGVVGSLAFAFSDSFWFSAVETEVYALSTTFIAVVVWAILKLDRTEDKSSELKWLILIAYLMGLSIGVHPMSLLAIPTLVYMYYFKKYKLSFKNLMISSFLGLGLTLFMMYGFRLGLVGMIKNFELIFTNFLSMPFYTGSLIFGILLFGALSYGILYSIKKQKLVLNTSLLVLSFIMVGYSSYTTVLIRSAYNPPIDQNNPEDIPNLINYLDMLQYGTRPLVYGENFTSKVISYEKGRAIYKKGEDKYEVADYVQDYKYHSSDLGFFPRMYSTSKHHVAGYKQWADLNEGETPSFSDNISFFLRYQIGHMYLRYFMWNFAGRKGDYQDAGWLAAWEDTSILPKSLKENAALNNFYFLPFLLGLIGLYFHYRKDIGSFLGIAALFVVTGVGLVVYLNSPVPEPRERDYIYVASFLSYAIWLGLGVLGVNEILQRISLPKYVLKPASAMLLSVPILMMTVGWDDHDRSDRYFTSDIARNHLATCAENAILFTGGDNDTYPLWYVQEVEDYRTDIRAVVLSYFNAAWYIEQMNRQAYESDPLPFSLVNQNYQRGGLNDYLPFVERPNLKGQSIDLRQYLKLIKTEHPALQVETMNGDFINTIPSRSLKLDVDVSRVKEKDIVPDTLLPYLTNTLNISMTGNALHKSDLMILDVIANNNWERPIYFTYTALSSMNIDLSGMVVQEGYTYRLLPIVSPDPEITLVNSESMYDNLMNKFKWREIDNKDVNYTDYHLNQLTHVRSNYNQLANALIEEGKLEKAREALFRNLEVIPDDTIPYDVSSINTARMLNYVGEKEKGLEIANILSDRIEDELSYYVDHQPKNSEQIRRNFTILSMLAQTQKEVGNNEEAAELEQSLRLYYDKINKI